MNVSKNYNSQLLVNNMMPGFKLSLTALFISIMSLNVNAAELTTTGAIDSTAYFKVVLGLVFVIALFLVSTFLFKRYGHGAMTGRGQLQVVDGLHLGNRERLVLVELNSKQILLAITPGQIRKLDTVEKVLAKEASFAPLMDEATESFVNNESQNREAGNA